MSAQAMSLAASERLGRVPQVQTRPKAVRRPAKRTGRVVQLPGPEALLHPAAADALILAFRPLSWSR